MHTSSISVAEVGKPPDIAQAHSIAHAGEDKLNLVAPVPSPGVFILLHWLTWNCSVLQQRQGERQGWLQVAGKQMCFWDSCSWRSPRAALGMLKHTLFYELEMDAATEKSILKGRICPIWPDQILLLGVHVKYYSHQYHATMVNNKHLWVAYGVELFMCHAHTHSYWIFSIKYYLLCPKV